MDDALTWPALIAAAEAGDRAARDRLFSTFYDELRRLAKRELNHGAGPVVTISSTALVHEAYAGLALRQELAFPDKGRFMAYMARAMRGVIVDSAREKYARKRGGEFHITRLDTHLAENLPEVPQLEQLSEALDALGVQEPRLAEVVDLKYFCGFSFVEIAAMREVTERTVQRDWEKARLLLYSALQAAD